MTGKQAGKPLSLKASGMARTADKNQAKLGKIRGLRAMRIGIFCWRYTSPAGNRLSQPKIGSTTQTEYLIAEQGCHRVSKSEMKGVPRS